VAESRRAAATTDRKFQSRGTKSSPVPQRSISLIVILFGRCFVWDEKLDRFIANPDEVVAGNTMKPYGILESSEDRKKIVTFLAQQK
jgi:cytochrome c